MSDLKTNLEAILQEKQDKIIPANIKKDVQIFDVIGTYTGNSGTDYEVKLFETEEEMQADENAQEGDLAVIYRSEIQNMTVDTQTQYIIFPETVTLPGAVTSSSDCMLTTVDSSSGFFDGRIQLTSTQFRFNVYFDTGSVTIQYSSTDGVNYTRTTEVTNPVDLGTIVGVYSSEEWNDNMGYFMQIGENVFEGLYEYQNKFNEDYIMSYNNIKYNSNLTYNTKSIYIKDFINFIKSNILNNDSLNIRYFKGLVIKVDDTHYTVYSLDFSETGILGLTPNTLYYNNTLYVLFDTMAGTIVNSEKMEIDINAGTYTLNKIPVLGTVLDFDYIAQLDNNQDIFTIDIRPSRIFYEPLYVYHSTTEYDKIECSIGYVTNYQFAPTQLTAIKDNVYNLTYYGKDGVNEGALTQNVSNSFADANAEIYYKIQQVYDNMEPRILTDEDKEIDKNIYFIPTKPDGTVLLDTSQVTDMQDMFSGCDNLTEIPLLNTSKVTNMNNMFNDCNNLTEIPLLDTSSVTSMISMFNGCKNLTEIPLLNTSKVTNMNNMFNDCNNLTEIPLLDTSSVTRMNSMFNGCKNLTEIPLLDTGKVTSMVTMFMDCVNLTTSPQLNTSSVTAISSMFDGCINLTTESLNNILQMCVNAVSYTRTKTLKSIGLTEEQAQTCTTLSNYEAFTAAGWTTGY